MSSVIITLFLVGLGLCTPGNASRSSPRVVTPLGTVEGTYNTTKGGRLYEAYRGIPYAQPPIGKSRFQVADKVSPWKGVLPTKTFSTACIQYSFTTSNISQAVQGSEDCLYLNVYTPPANRTGSKTTLLPVIFFIPGGAFQVGNGNQYGPKYLLDRDVTLVTINYRVGPMGFLSTEDEIVPGNAGLKDQVMALRWVKDNIKSFGGDPSKITIVGQSAGSVSVHYHFLSKLTKGLFRGGISMSGTALNSWSLQECPLEKSKTVASTVGCPTDDIESMVECLQSLPAEDIVRAVSVFEKWLYSPANVFVPSIEKGGGEFTFIDRSPTDIITSQDAHDVPWLTGVVSHEGLNPTAYYIRDTEVFGELDANWTTVAPYLLNYNDTIGAKDKPRVGRVIKRHYVGESTFNRTTFDQLTQMVGNRLFTSAVEKAANLQARANRSPVYTYYFTYRGAHSVTETMSGTTEKFGVCHGDDLRYVLDGAGLDPTTTAQDLAMQKVMTDLWVSFATKGKPDVGVKWPELRRSDNYYRYMHIAGPRNITMRRNSDFADKKFWQSIHFQ